MEEVIEKWETLLELDSNKDITYGRRVLQEMLTDVKLEIKKGSLTNSICCFCEYYSPRKEGTIQKERLPFHGFCNNPGDDIITVDSHGYKDYSNSLYKKLMEGIILTKEIKIQFEERIIVLKNVIENLDKQYNDAKVKSNAYATGERLKLINPDWKIDMTCAKNELNLREYILKDVVVAD